MRRYRFRKGEVPSRGPRHAVETGLFFGERVERIRTNPPRGCRSSLPNRLTKLPAAADLQDHSVPLPMGRSEKGWHIARRPLSIEPAEALAGGGLTMRKRALLVAALGLTLASCVGVYGPKGNDTGGIIPWSPDAERDALNIAQANCGQFNKYAVITSVHRVYGDYIAYSCWWYPPRGKRYHS